MSDIKEGAKETQGMVTPRQDPTQLSLLFMLTKAGRFLNSRPAWDRTSFGPGRVGMVISEPGLTHLAYCLCSQMKANL